MRKCDEKRLLESPPVLGLRSIHAVRLYWLLVLESDAEGLVRDSIASMARRLGMTHRNTGNDAIGALRAAGLVERIETEGTLRRAWRVVPPNEVLAA